MTLQVSLSRLKADITPKLKGTSLRQITDFYGIASSAANRMLSRLDTQETRRTATFACPFYDNVQDYAFATDYKLMIDIHPQANLRHDLIGNSHFSQTSARQFSERFDWNSFSIQWNNGVRTLRSQRLPMGDVLVMDMFEGAAANGLWVAGGDASNLYTEPLNFVQGQKSLGMDLSGSTGSADILNTTALAADLSSFRYNDASMMYVYIPLGSASRFTSFKLSRGSDASNYVQATVTTKADGTAFTDGWNFLIFQWKTATTTGAPDDTLNTYRKLTTTYTTGAAITGFLVDSWTDSLGMTYEMEYYSECLFRTAAGVWIYTPTDDTDLVCVGPTSYEILKAEMMIDITQNIREGLTRERELNDWRIMLDGNPRTGRDGLYQNYGIDFPSSSIPVINSNYTWDV